MLTQYTIYAHPSDYPEGFVVRAWQVEPGKLSPGAASRTPTLEAARVLIPDGLIRQPRDPMDDPPIVETWI